MSDKLLYQQSSVSSSQPPRPSVVNQLFELVASRDLGIILRKALGMAMQIFRAEAGSIVFLGNLPRRARAGTFRSEVLPYLDRLENTVAVRLQKSVLRAADSDPLISVNTLAESQLCLVNAPLLCESRVVGSLSLVLPPGSEVTEYQRYLMHQVIGGVGQMASLVAELKTARRSLKQLSVMYQVGQALVTTLDINKLLSKAMQLAANVIDAGAASLMLVDEEHGDLVFEVSHGSRGDMLRQQRIPADEGIAGWVARHGRPVIANEARSDPRFSHRVDVRTGFLTQSIAAVPVKIQGRVIGVLEVLNKYSGAGFDDEDIQLMSSIAAQAAIALENARLYQQVRQERDLIIKGQEDVRWELARNLHDGPVQLLSAISMSLDYMERLNKSQPEAALAEIVALRRLVHQAARDTRSLLFELRPIILETQGLVSAFQQYVNQLRDSESFTIHFITIDEVNYDTRVAGTIFSIVQEAINNIKRHARANDVWLSLEVKNDRFVVTVRDNGDGFDVARIESDYDQRGSFGILNMRERAALIEAELHIKSRTEMPNRGTLVQLVLPLPPERPRTKTNPIPAVKK
jgi:signal transduction histidine kinase